MDTVKKWSAKVIHSGQSSNVNILYMHHNLNGLKIVHETKYKNISDNLQRKDIQCINLNLIMFFIRLSFCVTCPLHIS